MVCMRNLFIFVTVLAAACVPAHPEPEAVVPQPAFSAQRFFDGHTEGRASLKIIMKAAHPVVVHGSGHLETDGTLVLDQSVADNGKPPTQRQWRIREVAPGRYAGTLSDAQGPVTGDVRGNMLHLQFRMKDGLDADQWLVLRPDGRSAANRMIVRKFGMVVATLDEVIRKTG